MTSPTTDRKTPSTIARWLGYLLFALFWGVAPSALSLLGRRHGWAACVPGILNLLGLAPLAVGILGSVATFRLHFAEAGGRLDFEPVKDYLTTRGTYGFSRNPMYLFDLTLMLGWLILYGSVAILIALLAWAAFFHFVQVPSEERSIEIRHGGVYRVYRRSVPRWIRLPWQRSPGTAGDTS